MITKQQFIKKAKELKQYELLMDDDRYTAALAISDILKNMESMGLSFVSIDYDEMITVNYFHNKSKLNVDVEYTDETWILRPNNEDNLEALIEHINSWIPMKEKIKAMLDTIDMKVIKENR